MKIQVLFPISGNGKVKQYSTPYIDETVRDFLIIWDKYEDNKNIQSLVIIKKKK